MERGAPRAQAGVSNSTLNTFGTTGDLDLFYHCWRLVNCESCLGSEYPCSWCAVSQACVPNTRFKWPFAILAPIKDENICPLGWRERWEMRAKPFSCRCSSMTFMSVVVAVLSTLLGVLLIWLLCLLSKWSWKKWKAREPGWWKVHRYKWRLPWPYWKSRDGKSTVLSVDEEQRPLLA